MESAEAVADRRKPDRPNWLLSGLILVSIGIHAGILMQISGLTQPRPTPPIELTVRAPQRPPARAIPRPPVRPTPPPPTETDPAPKVRPITPQPTPPPPAETPAPKAPPAPTPPVSAPSAPSLSAPAIADWNPPPAPAPVAAPAPPEPRPSRVSPRPDPSAKAEYLARIRSRIESRKHYPHRARRQRIEGTVVVRFVIGTDGRVDNVEIVESSRHRVLNEAALSAIRNASPFPRPPDGLSAGPMTLEVPIVFDLT